MRLAASLPSDDDDLDAFSHSHTQSLTRPPLQRPLALFLRRRYTAVLTHTHAADDEHDVAARSRPG